jgi:putative OPT family oligopeptide transporter
VTNSSGPKAEPLASPARSELVPYVGPDVRTREFTLRAVLLGLVMSVLFNAANAYVGLKIGLTVSASIPSAVISMALLRKFLPRLQKAFGIHKAPAGTILENNIVHAIASTGEALAAGIIFTLPSIFFLTAHPGPAGYPEGGILPGGWESFLYGALGGGLGILAMVPLRRYITIDEHRNLPFPEGVACAKVLIAGDAGGLSAKPVFAGIAVGGLGKLLMSGIGLFRESVFRSFPMLHKASLGFEPTPVLAGVGYLIGVRVASIMLAGSLLGSIVLIPLIDWIGQGLDHPVAPATSLIRDLDGMGIRNAYIKYIGAGGVALGGLVGIVRTFPDAVASIRSTARALAVTRAGKSSLPRTEEDIPLVWVVLGILGLAFGIGSLPAMHSPAWGGWTVVGLTLLAIAFSFFFVVVSARTVGLVGSSSQPVSGMTITAVLAASLALALLGHTGTDGRLAAMTIGAVVCISICLSGDVAQDLKTGALVGATPKYIQWGQLIGTAGAALRAGVILWLLHHAYHLGSSRLAAPQAELMAQLVRGATGGSLPWALLLLGAGIGLVVELCGVSALAFSIGLYLPISTWPPLFVGGLVSWLVGRQRGSVAEKEDRHERGTLFASGLVAGDALTGIAISMLAVAADQWSSERSGAPSPFPLTRWAESYGALNDMMPLLAFGGIIAALVWTTRPKRNP